MPETPSSTPFHDSQGYQIAFTLESGQTLDNNLQAQLIRAIAATLNQHEVSERTGVTVVITEDARVRELNREFRHIDAATDILSFPADPLPDEIQQAENDGDYLGDLIIALPFTRAQAERLGHSFADEMTLLIVHGSLHLLDYDHDSTDNQLEMWNVQHAILESLGVTIRVPLFSPDDTDDH